MAQVNEEPGEEEGDEGPNKLNDNLSNEDADSNFGDCNNDGPRKSQKVKVKSLLTSQGGYSTLYKTQGKDNNNQRSTKFKQFNFEKRTHTRYNCPLSHFDGYNLWLLKPTHLNRGRGIHVFNDLPTLHRLIKEYCIGKDEESWKKKTQGKVDEQG
jgi:hypothetical protein